MASILEILRRLADANVEFVLIGGMAGAVHGSSVVTEDVDVCIPFERENLTRILGALKGLSPRQRMHPARPPLSEDPEAYRGFKNLYVVTDAGQVDFLGNVLGVGDYARVAKDAIEVDLGGFRCRVISLEDLLSAKRALGRVKDLRTVEELERVKRKKEST